MGLADHLTGFINAAFLREKNKDPEQWDVQLSRFNSRADLFEMLGENGLFCIMYDKLEEDDGPFIGTERGSLVACAAAVPWTGEGKHVGSEVGGEDKEEGWEIKVVCVDGHRRYAKKGLATQVVACLEEYLVRQSLEASRKDGSAQVNEINGKVGGQGELVLWILAAACLYGTYWEKRGYSVVRRRACGAGIWGSKREFEMLVMNKIISI
jgi:hypothetical protein